jgi:hypothetical protein
MVEMQPLCRSTWHCVQHRHLCYRCVLQVIKNEGMKSLFKGAGANILRAVAGAGVLSGYDQLQVRYAAADCLVIQHIRSSSQDWGMYMAVVQCACLVTVVLWQVPDNLSCLVWQLCCMK